jgi:hypothetical protein
MLHISLHILIPALVSWLFFPTRWKMVWLIMMLTMLVDLDHLFANPIYDPNRCSIGFHPLHSYSAITGYLFLGIFPKTRVIAYGLLIHMALDGLYCLRLAL